MVTKTKIKYKRLPGRSPFIIRLFFRCSLYIGNDHILAIDNKVFSEDYKRFYFSDIQAIITRKTKSGAVWNIVLAFLTACVLPGVLLPNDESLRLFFWIVCGIILVALLINILRGPTCICHIMTAVQEDKLSSLHRLRTARKTIRTIRRAIEKVQGMLSLEEINASHRKDSIHAKASLNTLRRPHGRGRQIRHYNGTVHMIAFISLIADGILTSIAFVYHTLLISAASSALGVIYFMCIIIALAKQYASDIPRMVRVTTWASLVFVLISYVLSYILMITAFMRKPHVVMSQWDMYRAMLDLSPHDSSFLMAIYEFSAICALVLGVLGLIGLKKHRDISAIKPGGPAESRRKR
jgi:ABC-type multidrug transport system fused ATPase/permease subunit